MSGCFEVSNVVSTNETFQNRTHCIKTTVFLLRWERHTFINILFKVEAWEATKGLSLLGMQ